MENSFFFSFFFPLGITVVNACNNLNNECGNQGCSQEFLFAETEVKLSY